MTFTSPWDEIDLVILGTLINPHSLDDLIEQIGLTPNFVKSQVDAYVRCGQVGRNIITYTLTDLGRHRLTRLRTDLNRVEDLDRAFLPVRSAPEAQAA